MSCLLSGSSGVFACNVFQAQLHNGLHVCFCVSFREPFEFIPRISMQQTVGDKYCAAHFSPSQATKSELVTYRNAMRWRKKTLLEFIKKRNKLPIGFKLPSSVENQIDQEVLDNLFV